jgi:hypothetical protein
MERDLIHRNPHRVLRAVALDPPGSADLAELFEGGAARGQAAAAHRGFLNL